ncbi:hypothetical protein BAUCODRAFT_380777 [Baudoinia panamericana UAMH 10762]|uniref:Uncharacterized protein n=1 Tax=Baudoinia panamericana (strain UAMH 10762) TaxID=717646 RepID=M2LVW0_BAUPA|nr:uncharacterized protein BAUCODRAFT_380777 [Baudoinia panamericana UAMH 10762]EMC98807.1 hypothetical protein BAUCODRAFT_380777 [Baudoinia panamericana UAMH 10762]
MSVGCLYCLKERRQRNATADGHYDRASTAWNARHAKPTHRSWALRVPMSHVPRQPHTLFCVC